ncbi:hypothetical protein OZX69_03525 [Lactobacillus sp. ESL0731]|uniref:hypothetical protein n=1 Tax=unclassified Lactobacillus TaxID=2620435 RepID=UPI0023F89B03|nr:MULTISPECIES: hypothetical protein [unclassified Lactobacillus]WEV51780.1 hypothetical protein OZX63_03525 [Lactobacillus sp. ESL0700]WEV62909.1 hypothetical protein OZX69_03525 [Lactobacillus sp. ESL0731]
MNTIRNYIAKNRLKYLEKSKKQKRWNFIFTFIYFGIITAICQAWGSQITGLLESALFAVMGGIGYVLLLKIADHLYLKFIQ